MTLLTCFVAAWLALWAAFVASDKTTPSLLGRIFGAGLVSFGVAWAGLCFIVLIVFGAIVGALGLIAATW